MIHNKKVLGLIMARGGSKGFPGKNLKPLGGKPLIVWTIDAANNAKYLDRVIVSTDDAKIATVCEQHGCTAPFMRPSHLAEDHSTAVDVAIHALDTLDESFDYLVLLQATSPHRSGEDINGCLELCASHQAPGCVSVTRVDKPPEWMFHLDADSRLQPLLGSWDFPQRRQMTNAIFALNGAVYVVDIRWFRAQRRFVADGTLAFEMPPDRSVDIDSATDLRKAEAFLD